MKRIPLLIIVLIILTFSSCVSTKKYETASIKGLVEEIAFDNFSYSISENYESRSKINNCIIVKDSNKAALETLKNKVGEIITADVKIIKDDGLWVREVILLNIQ